MRFDYLQFWIPSVKLLEARLKSERIGSILGLSLFILHQYRLVMFIGNPYPSGLLLWVVLFTGP